MSSSQKPILIVFTQHTKLLNSDKTTGCYLPEIAHPYLKFKKAGINFVAASPNGGEAPLDPSSLEAFKEDAESQEWLKDEEAQEWRKNTKKLSTLKPEDYSAIFYPGGHGKLRPRQANSMCTV
jgi:putative intracellular protease/amidase